MVSDQILEGFKQFITVEQLQAVIDDEVEARIAKQLEKYGEMVKEIEKKAQQLDLSKVTITKLTGSGTWTKNESFNHFRVICHGGGAGGSTGHYDLFLGFNYGGRGGGGGACAERLYLGSELGISIPYSVGAGGAGRTNGGDGPGAGTAGGDTWFGSGNIAIRAGGGQPGGKPDGNLGSNSPGGVATAGSPGANLLTGGYGGRIGSAGGDGASGPFATYGGSAGGGGGGYNSGFSTSFQKPQAGGRSGTLIGGPAPNNNGDGINGKSTVVDSVAQIFQLYGGSGGSGGGSRRRGGNGGFPGGGGGGGGTDGKGGDGAAGCIYIIQYNA